MELNIWGAEPMIEPEKPPATPTPKTSPSNDEPEPANHNVLILLTPILKGLWLKN